MKSLLRYSIGLFSLGLVLTFIGSVSAQAQTDKDITEIRSQVAAINKGVAKYKKVTKDVDDVSLEGAEATYYRSGEDLKKITTRMYGETYKATGEFYYRDGELIFGYIRHSQYDTQIGLSKPVKVIRVEERRYYFAGGVLIKLMVGKKTLKSDSEKYSQLKDEIIDISGKLTAQ
ncbi:MAG: hypothetical protein KA831_07940 [Pyrinomonadaceae bacterium]|nr:hypothetical protein [Pyrinomonadaceae bacterium]